MNPQLVQQFLLQNGSCFDPLQLPVIQERLAEVDDAKSANILGANFQNPTVILIIAILLGWERFFLDDIGLGILKVLTCYGVGIWWLVDIFTAKKRTYAFNFARFQQALLLSR